MNIKGLGQNLFPVDVLKKVDRRKAEQTHDREPGSQGGGSQNPKHHHLTDEEVNEAIQRLKEIPGVKEANFQFRIVRENDRVILFVEDPAGKVVRRLADNELWLMLKEKSQSKGNLLNKSM